MYITRVSPQFEFHPNLSFFIIKETLVREHYSRRDYTEMKKKKAENR